ncbi:MAG: hypothetical protein ABR884_02850 [Minisyncoccia bacterium]|jgi:hypothetical protein
MQIAPYISDHKRKRKRRRAYLLTALGLVIFYGIFFAAQWLVLRSPVFRVDHVVVQGNSAISNTDVIALAEASAFPSHDILRAALTFDNMLLWPASIPQGELQMIPQLANANISKDFFSHTITITVTERSPFGIWCFSASPGVSAASTTATDTNAPCYWFDNTGTIFEKAGETQGDLVYTVYDRAQAPRGLNQKVLSDEFLPNFISIMNVLHASGLSVQAIELNDLSLQEVDVQTANGPTIYFSLQFPADEYLPVIQKLMLQSNFDKLQYVDCRTENRLFYK